MVDGLDDRARPGGDLAFSLTAHKRYLATVQLLVQPSVSAGGLGAAQQPATQTDVQTELQLVTSAPVQQAVRGRLKNAPAVSASQVGQTIVIAITASSGVPSRAALVANLYATAFVQYRQAVATRNLAAAEAQLRSQALPANPAETGTPQKHPGQVRGAFGRYVAVGGQHHRCGV
jgi:uncharacterized protein involved in exopolysaccharide biosynthesis